MFFLLPRVAVVLAIVFGLLLARRLYGQWQQRLRADRLPVPRLPASLVAGADRTFVVFTTPLCASCGPVAEQLRGSDPGARVVKVDATADVALADAFRVRSAPTVLLADASGEVSLRLVGAGAVSEFVAARAL